MYRNKKIKGTNASSKKHRNATGFIKGSSLDDTTAHSVLGKHSSFPSQNKQSLWIHMRALEHFVIMANTEDKHSIALKAKACL